MSALTTAAAAVDTDLTQLNTDILALGVLIKASQTTYQNANPGKYQQGLAGWEENIRAAILSKPGIADLMRFLGTTNPVAPALATQFAAF